jgi:DNA-directed RNA polymerase I subunit RPA43
LAIFEPFPHVLFSSLSRLNGILAGFGKIYLRSPTGYFNADEAPIHLDVASDFWVFRPTVGAQLRGVVNRKSQSHVSCLVHGCFNVPCYRPPQTTVDEWCGTRAKIGQVVRFIVAKTDMTQKIPFILGNLQVIDQTIF